MNFDIKARCARLRITMKSLIPEIEKRLPHFKVYPVDLSNAVNSFNPTPKEQEIMSAVNEILSEMEKK